MIGVTLASAAASACGSTAQQFFSHSFETDKARLEQFFAEQQCIDDLRFAPDSADPLVALVLVNAADAGVDKRLYENVLTRFNCVAQIRRRSASAYQTIIDYVGEDRYAELCPEERLRRVYVVAADGGANLRATPDSRGERIGAIAQGVVANDGVRMGEWIHVTTHVGEGYMHESTLRLYLPEPEAESKPGT